MYELSISVPGPGSLYYVEPKLNGKETFFILLVFCVIHIFITTFREMYLQYTKCCIPMTLRQITHLYLTNS